MRHYLGTLLLLTACIVSAQTDYQEVQRGLAQLEDMAANSPFKNVTFENIGPSVMSGRVVDVDVNPDNPVEMLVAYASGGLWHTKNNGTSFEPIMDNASTINLGDIAVDWDNRTIWAGTGENNSSRSSYAGIGILKSTDWGKTWSKPMFAGSQHIGRILINPSNPDHVVVAITGPLYTLSNHRGIYTTMDGGATWKKTLYATDMAGFIDLAAAPEDFNVMFAASWEKDRKAWNFDGDGEASAIYKSTDAGATWNKVSTANSGFPTGSGIGRIGLAVYDADTIYTIHDSQFRREKDASATNDESENELGKDDFKTMSREDFLDLDKDKLNKFLKQNGFQEKYRAENVKNMVRGGTAQPADLALYLEDANSQLFDTPVKGAELYKSIDGGKTWNKTHEGQIDDVFYSYGYYFAQVRVDPQDVNKVYVMGVPIIKSADGGKNWESISRENVHADHHALWVNPEMSGHLINGNDGGLNISYDDGETWIKNNSPSVGQFYAINYDMEEPYNVYGGLQDNGVWVAAHNAREDRAWHQRGQYPWESIMGGDGMQVQIDNRNSDIVYTGFQFGNYYRINRETGDRTYIQPKHELGESPYRFNWQTPILLSSHNQDILYLGGNKLHRSMNKGDDWTAISPDLTQGGKEGNVAYGTLTSISESPFEFGLIITGSDDGLVQITQDGGATWRKAQGGWPADLWVSRVVASQHDKNRFYVALNGYRNDDFTPYLFMSNDAGMTWENIGAQLPSSPINVIIEHPEDKNMVFVGTDNAVYVATQPGAWSLFNADMPPVAVHDLKIQPQANDLLVGTHGRSIYLANLDAMSLPKADASENAMGYYSKKLKMAPVEGFRATTRYGSKGFMWSDAPEPSVAISYFSPRAETTMLTIKNEDGKVVQELELDADNGLNFYDYNGTVSESGRKKYKKDMQPKVADNGSYYLPKGNYTVSLENSSGTATQNFEVK